MKENIINSRQENLLKEDSKLILNSLTYQDGNLFGIFERQDNKEKFVFQAEASKLEFNIIEDRKINDKYQIHKKNSAEIVITLDVSENDKLFEIFSTKEMPHTLTKNQIEEILGYKINIAAE